MATYSTIDTQLKKIIDENPDIENYVKTNPQLMDVLTKQYHSLYENQKGIIKGAELVDKVDQFLGPIEAALRWFGPGVGYIGSFGLRAIEELVFKIPYSIYYAGKTKDYKGVIGYILAETAATVLPYGDLLDVLPVYEWTAKKYFRDEVAKSFLEYVRKPRAVPGESTDQPRKKQKSLDDALEPAA